MSSSKVQCGEDCIQALEKTRAELIPPGDVGFASSYGKLRWSQVLVLDFTATSSKLCSCLALSCSVEAPIPPSVGALRAAAAAVFPTTTFFYFCSRKPDLTESATRYTISSLELA